MTCKIKYVLLGNYSKDCCTGKLHYVSSTSLLGLYNLNREDCIFIDKYHGGYDSEQLVRTYPEALFLSSIPEGGSYSQYLTSLLIDKPNIMKRRKNIEKHDLSLKEVTNV